MARKPEEPSVAPEQPPPTEEADKRELTLLLQDTIRVVEQRNLNNAVLLPQQAARGHGPLIDHFCELGRRYAKLLDTPPKPTLRVIEGRPA